MSGTLYIIAAPSGAGKTTLVSALVEKTPNLVVSISHTTRPKRPREQDGENYFFVDVEQFNRMVAEGAFLEHAEVFGNFYGTSKRWVEQELARGHDVILEIDWQGAQQIKHLFPSCVSIFILPPSIDALKERLNRRNQDRPEVIERRILEAKEEIAHCGEFDYLVINRHFQTALIHLRAILTTRRLETQRQSILHSDLIEQLLR